MGLFLLKYYLCIHIEPDIITGKERKAFYLLFSINDPYFTKGVINSGVVSVSTRKMFLCNTKSHAKPYCLAKWY